MAVQIVQVDAFTSRHFAGNPAAVCILDEPPPDWWLQDVAREMNLSETAFIIPHSEGYDLRWFTPSTEVDLCGHATLASAHVLWEDELLPRDEVVRFHTRSGLLFARRSGDWIELDFPPQPAEEIATPPEIEGILGSVPLWVGRSQSDILIELPHEKAVRSLSPDLRQVARLNARGVIVTSRAISAGADFVSRFFAPRVGIPEDPVTGSAHCTLGPFWAERLGKEELVGYQVSDRGGTVRVRVTGDGITLGGQAVTVMRGTLFA